MAWSGSFPKQKHVSVGSHAGRDDSTRADRRLMSKLNQFRNPPKYDGVDASIDTKNFHHVYSLTVFHTLKF